MPSGLTVWEGGVVEKPASGADLERFRNRDPLGVLAANRVPSNLEKFGKHADTVAQGMQAGPF